MKRPRTTHYIRFVRAVGNPANPVYEYIIRLIPNLFRFSLYNQSDKSIRLYFGSTSIRLIRSDLAFLSICLYNLSMSQSSKLFRLQQIDRQLDIANSRLREIEIALGETAELHNAETHHSTKEDTLRKEQKKLQHAEEEVQRQQDKIKQTELTLYGGTVRNPKELQDLQNEAAALKRYLSVLEDRQLDAMLLVEEAEADLAESTAMLEKTRIQVAKMHNQLKDERASLCSNVNRLEIERLAAVNDITSDDLDLYDQMRRQKGGVAVVQITDKACAACGSTLTAALIQSAHSTSQIARCSSCGRLLYPG